jgi:hypothetical protein
MQSPASKCLAPYMWPVFWEGALVGESAPGFTRSQASRVIPFTVIHNVCGLYLVKGRWC